jgi:internalin A
MANPTPNIAEARRRIAEAAEKGLDQLDLSGLDLLVIPEELSALTNLKQLDLGAAKDKPAVGVPAHNRISALDARLCTALTQLQTLILASNELTGLPPEIGSLQALEVLDVSSNKLASLPDG